jgi:hypothetical protein
MVETSEPVIFEEKSKNNTAKSFRLVATEMLEDLRNVFDCVVHQTVEGINSKPPEQRMGELNELTSNIVHLSETIKNWTLLLVSIREDF